VCQSLVVDHDGDRVTVAMVKPGDLRSRACLVDVLRQFHGEFVAVAEDDLARHTARLLGAEVGVSAPDTPFDSLTHVTSAREAIEIAQNGEDDVLPGLLTSAIRTGASDVHIEPHDEGSRIRLRVDGRMFPTDHRSPVCGPIRGHQLGEHQAVHYSPVASGGRCS